MSRHTVCLMCSPKLFKTFLQAVTPSQRHSEAMLQVVNLNDLRRANSFMLSACCKVLERRYSAEVHKESKTVGQSVH